MARQQASRPLQINWRPRRDIENVGRVFSVVSMVFWLLIFPAKWWGTGLAGGRNRAETWWMEFFGNGIA